MDVNGVTMLRPSCIATARYNQPSKVGGFVKLRGEGNNVH